MFDPIYLRIGTVIFSLLTLYFQCKMKKLGQYKLAWDLPITIWAVLTLLFYAILFANDTKLIDVHTLYPSFFGDWSSALRMYGAGTFFWSTYFRYKIFHVKDHKNVAI